MKFRVERDVLAEAVAWTARSLPSRPAAPVLAGLVIEASASDDAGDTVTVSGFDYEVSSRSQIAAEVEQPGRVLVSGKLLAEIAKSLPNRPVDFTIEGSRVRLSCGTSRFGLQTLPLDDYPSLPTMPGASGAVTAAGLVSAVSQVAVAAGRDEVIPIFTGILMEIEGDKITLAATDRYRLAVRELQWKPERENLSTTALIPAKFLSDASKALNGSAWASLSLPAENTEGGLIGLKSGSDSTPGGRGPRQMTARLLSGEYVRYRGLLPTDYSITATVETAPFLEAVKRVSLVAERNSPVTLAFTEGEVSLEAGAGDEADASEALEAVLDGEDITVAYNPGYLLDGLGAIDTQYVQFSFTTAAKPTVLMGRPSLDSAAQEDFRYLVLPLKKAQPQQSAR